VLVDMLWELISVCVLEFSGGEGEKEVCSIHT